MYKNNCKYLKYNKIKKRFKYKLNKAYYGFRMYQWFFNIGKLFKNSQDVEINKPIFLLGTQGGGLTLISRMIRRHHDVVSPTGNCMYWTGADEMCSVFGRVLPIQLTAANYHDVMKKFNRNSPGWMYASDEYFNLFRNDASDVTAKIRSKFHRVIKWSIKRYAKNPANSRFTDKSQIYTIKMLFINELLKEFDPKFILITRNPYAMCYRTAASTNSEYTILVKEYGFLYALDYAAQHWTNSMQAALDDKKKVRNFMQIKFEDFLIEPEVSMKKVCKFAELNYNPDMLPKSSDKLPLGTIRGKRWYPLNPKVNDNYLNKLNEDMIEVIHKRCGHLASYFGYELPKPSGIQHK